MPSKPSTLKELPKSDDKVFWKEADMHSVYNPEGYSVEECKHHFVNLGGNVIQCRFCHFGGPLKSKKDKITLRSGRTYGIHSSTD